MSALFLTADEVRVLTGYAVKDKQIAQLRRMGIAFFVNGGGRPVITVSAVEGRKQGETITPAWRPAVLTAISKAA